MTERAEGNRFLLILIGWHAFYPETFLREESGDSYDDGWFDWKLHIKLSGAQDLNTFIEKILHQNINQESNQYVSEV